jgi:hypothetical protein
MPTGFPAEGLSHERPWNMLVVFIILACQSMIFVFLCSAVTSASSVVSPLTSTLVVLGSQVLNKLDVLLLGVGRAQVLELGPLVVLCLALQSNESAAVAAKSHEGVEDRNVP